MSIVDINEQGQVYVCNTSSPTKYGWCDVSEITCGCDYIITINAGASGIATTVNKTGYSAVVATWREETTTITSNDPIAQEGTGTTSNVSMTTTNVNYQELVNPYAMPFDFLWALLVVGEDKEFAFEIAELVYGSEIEVTIHDNLTVNTDINELHYTKRTKAEVEGTIRANYEGERAVVRVDKHTHEPYREDENFVTTKTTVTRTNTLDVALTKANVWIGKYQNEYTYSALAEGETIRTEAPSQDQEYPEEPSSTGTSYACQEIERAKNRARAQVMPEGEVEVYTVPVEERINVKYYQKYININDIVSNKTDTQKYIKGVPDFAENTDKDSQEPNFVTIFNKSEYKENKRRTKDVARWLFEILETNESTSDMVDLMKYLLYRATGNVYDEIDEFDFDAFFAGRKLTSLGSGIYGGTIEEKVWWAVINAGYSKEAAAGVMGNIYRESGFNTNAIEAASGEGKGLGQWSFGRRQQLEAYAMSKGKDWTDEDTQVEFLIGEITPGGIPERFADEAFMNANGYKRSDWENATTPEEAAIAFCWTFERPAESQAGMNIRTEAARRYYEQFKDQTMPTGTSSAVVREARGALGVPYVWGGEDYVRGMDCSGLVKVCYKRALGIDLPHYTGSLMTDSRFETVSGVNKLSAGDIIVSSIHVGIYTGSGTVIHAPNKNDVVKEENAEAFISRGNYIFRHYKGAN